MDEFTDRMATQRNVLNIVNSNVAAREELFGLSEGAIDRWVLENKLECPSRLASQLKKISAELFFMATHSQEPVSSDYEHRRQKIAEAVRELQELV